MVTLIGMSGKRAVIIKDDSKFEFDCPVCQTTLWVEGDFAGEVECPDCSTRLEVGDTTPSTNYQNMPQDPQPELVMPMGNNPNVGMAAGIITVGIILAIMGIPQIGCMLAFFGFIGMITMTQAEGASKAKSTGAGVGVATGIMASVTAFLSAMAAAMGVMALIAFFVFMAICGMYTGVPSG